MAESVVLQIEKWAPTRANGDLFAGALLETLEPTATPRPLSASEVDGAVAWLAAVEPHGKVNHANSELVRAIYDPLGTSSAKWVGEVNDDREIQLIASLPRNPEIERGNVRIPIEALGGWWAFALSAMSEMASSLNLWSSRLRLFLHPYGRSSERAVGFSFADCPPARQRVEGQQIPPWEGIVASVDPLNVPITLVADAIGSLLDRFSYGAVEDSLDWLARAAQDGTLATCWTRSYG